MISILDFGLVNFFQPFFRYKVVQPEIFDHFINNKYIKGKRVFNVAKKIGFFLDLGSWDENGRYHHILRQTWYILNNFYLSFCHCLKDGCRSKRSLASRGESSI